MQDLEFLECQKDDIKEVVNIVNEAYRGEKPSKAWTGEAHLLGGKRLDDEMLEEILKQKDTKTYVAKLQNKIIATIQTKLEENKIHIGLFAVEPNVQASGVGKKLLEFAEKTSSKLWNKNNFIMEVISSRIELIEYYNRRGYESTNTYIDFPKSELWIQKTSEDLKFLVLKKDIGY